MRFARPIAILAAAFAFAATAAQADSTAHNGWQCTARSESITVYRWLKDPQAEAGVTVTDSNPVYESTDSAFKYSMSPTNQYFSVSVTFGSDHRILRDNFRIMPQGLKVDILDGTKVLTSGTLGVSRDADFYRDQALAVLTTIANPLTASLTVRLSDTAGKPLASYTIPVPGFRTAAETAAQMMGKDGTGGIGKGCP